QDTPALNDTLQKLGFNGSDSYIFDNFSHWLSIYAKAKPDTLHDYFLESSSLNDVCNQFINFCFKHGISLDKHRTLESFHHHNKILDKTIVSELIKVKPRPTINLLGFGLGNGEYEKSIAKKMVEMNIAKQVKIFGFDPYGEDQPDIVALTADQLLTSEVPIFDVVIARWVLHHVDLKHRWADLARCINRRS